MNQNLENSFSNFCEEGIGNLAIKIPDTSLATATPIIADIPRQSRQYLGKARHWEDLRPPP